MCIYIFIYTHTRRRGRHRATFLSPLSANKSSPRLMKETGSIWIVHTQPACEGGLAIKKPLSHCFFPIKQGAVPTMRLVVSYKANGPNHVSASLLQYKRLFWNIVALRSWEHKLVQLCQILKKQRPYHRWPPQDKVVCFCLFLFCFFSRGGSLRQVRGLSCFAPHLTSNTKLTASMHQGPPT